MPRAFRSKAASKDGYFNPDVELKWYRTDYDSDPNEDRRREAKKRWNKQIEKMRTKRIIEEIIS